jgi:hypothetical protein
VFRSGERYVVPYYDEVGVGHRKEFQTREEARSFRWTVRFAQKHKSEHTGPSFKGHEWGPGIGSLASTSRPPSNDLPPGARASTEPSGDRTSSRTPGRFPRPGPERSYECLFAVASRAFGPVLNEQHRRFVRVAVSLAS